MNKKIEDQSCKTNSISIENLNPNPNGLKRYCKEFKSCFPPSIPASTARTAPP